MFTAKKYLHHGKASNSTEVEMYLTTATTTTGTLMRSNAQQIQIQVQMQRQIQIQILETYLTTATTTNWNCYCKALERSTEGFIFSVQGNWFWVWVLRGMREQQKFKNTTYDGFHTLYIKLFVNVKLILTSFYLRVNMNWLYECQQQISATLSHRILIIADVTGKLGWIGVVIIPDICHFFYTGKIFGE